MLEAPSNICEPGSHMVLLISPVHQQYGLEAVLRSLTMQVYKKVNVYLRFPDLLTTCTHKLNCSYFEILGVVSAIKAHATLVFMN